MPHPTSFQRRPFLPSYRLTSGRLPSVISLHSSVVFDKTTLSTISKSASRKHEAMDSHHEPGRNLELPSENPVLPSAEREEDEAAPTEQPTKDRVDENSETQDDDNEDVFFLFAANGVEVDLKEPVGENSLPAVTFDRAVSTPNKVATKKPEQASLFQLSVTEADSIRNRKEIEETVASVWGNDLTDQIDEPVGQDSLPAATFDRAVSTPNKVATKKPEQVSPSEISCTDADFLRNLKETEETVASVLENVLSDKIVLEILNSVEEEAVGGGSLLADTIDKAVWTPNKVATKKPEQVPLFKSSITKADSFRNPRKREEAVGEYLLPAATFDRAVSTPNKPATKKPEQVFKISVTEADSFRNLKEIEEGLASVFKNDLSDRILLEPLWDRNPFLPARLQRRPLYNRF